MNTNIQGDFQICIRVPLKAPTKSCSCTEITLTKDYLISPLFSVFSKPDYAFIAFRCIFELACLTKLNLWIVVHRISIHVLLTPCFLRRLQSMPRIKRVHLVRLFYCDFFFLFRFLSIFELHIPRLDLCQKNMKFLCYICFMPEKNERLPIALSFKSFSVMCQGKLLTHEESYPLARC